MLFPICRTLLISPFLLLPPSFFLSFHLSLPIFLLFLCAKKRFDIIWKLFLRLSHRYFKVTLILCILKQPCNEEKRPEIIKGEETVRTLFYDTVLSIFLFQGIPVCRRFCCCVQLSLKSPARWHPKAKSSWNKRKQWHFATIQHQIIQNFTAA